jgi:uncharacterized protein (TIGR01777 family)
MGKIILAGGTGFIGQSLLKRFKAAKEEVVLLSRSETSDSGAGAKVVHWDGKNLGDWSLELEGAELVVNLAGRSVDCRYNDKNKREILNSRVESTKALGLAIEETKNPPRLWINSSTATIYRHSEDKAMDEEDGEIGTGFSVGVAQAWEKAFWDARTPSTRKVVLRTAIVLGRQGGVLLPFKNLVRFGLGGSQGNGRQMFSWIHEEDLFEIIQFVRNGKVEGILNCAAPNPVADKELMKTLRRKMKVPFGIPSPRFLLGLGAFFIRTETELILKSRWVIPGRLIQAGYQFKYPTLTEAVDDLI